MGILIIKRMFDWEDVNLYILNVILFDGYVEVKLVVNIIVVDVNDNVLFFIGLLEKFNIIIINEFFKGVIVFIVEVVDKDFGLNGLVKYVIVSGNDD